MKNISAADANRHFSKLLKGVKGGEVVTVTSRGEPVAVIAPFGVLPNARYDRAKDILLARLRAQAPVGVTWTRDELYDAGQ
jgi:prevent-host-death family protein